MKKIFVSSLFTLMLFGAFVPPPVLTDYRDSYVGNYFCNRSGTIFNPSRSPDTFSDTLTVTITKDVQDSILDITAGVNTQKFKLQSSVLYSFPGDRRSGKFFASDSISFFTLIGHSSSSIYIGKKR